jgi:hypothetical protein
MRLPTDRVRRAITTARNGNFLARSTMFLSLAMLFPGPSPGFKGSIGKAKSILSPLHIEEAGLRGLGLKT